MDFATRWLLAFVWTNALELPVWSALLRRHARRWWEPALFTLAVNLVTHPCFALATESGTLGRDQIPIAELAIAASEGVVAAWFLIRRASPAPWRLGLLSGLLANASSWLLGSTLVDALLDA